MMAEWWVNVWCDAVDHVESSLAQVEIGDPWKIIMPLNLGTRLVFTFIAITTITLSI